ncbi:class I SAM-dependent RNA methyltransferase [Nioella sediminis]|uniref:class I SAM-dependent RNA methyltransferase n=1 Tax=Nioella sediminis TaxID=1912092 RepID=UPI0008FD5AB1|nr:class I SAM-dependent RNA methyltransferase [Nioella sediminis]TBX28291.1 RNA methyltransferase [Roseovarius sp. JS7-11]
MEITIQRLGHKGDGIAEGPVLAPLTLPGELVEGDVTDGRMDAPRILTPSPNRVKAPCTHFRQCGGCALQHASDSFLAQWKQQVVETVLAAQGLTTEFRPIHVSPPRSRRRATLAGTRTKKGALVGFHARRSDTIVPITDCHVLHPDLLAVLPTLEQITRMGGSRSATLAFALTRSDAGIDCAVTGGKPLDEALRVALPQFLRHFARLTWDDETVFTETPPVQHFGTVAVTPPPGAFLQATPDGEATLVAAMIEATTGAKHIVDLFSGSGTFSFPLAARTPVHAVEGDRTMIAALDHATRHAAGIKKVTGELRDLFRRPLMAEDLAPYDAAVIDPPRAGAEAQVRELAASGIAKIGFVSCNPVTFARDAKTLTDAGFRLDWVQVVDQFRWSPHVELAASFTRAHM